MLDAVVECLVKRQNTVGTYIARFFMFSIDAILLAASLFVLFYLTAYGIVIFVSSTTQYALFSMFEFLSNLTLSTFANLFK